MVVTVGGVNGQMGTVFTVVPHDVASVSLWRQ
jgi:hypothetical protein